MLMLDSAGRLGKGEVSWFISTLIQAQIRYV